MGKKQVTPANAIFELGPMPNHMIMMGKKISFGVAPK